MRIKPPPSNILDIVERRARRSAREAIQRTAADMGIVDAAKLHTDTTIRLFAAGLGIQQVSIANSR